VRLIFAGTPAFADVALRALIAAGHDIALVLTRADQPAGRGQTLTASPVKQTALAHGLAVLQPRTLRDPEIQQQLAAVGAQAMVVAAYGLLLPKPVLELPPLGCLNIHGSLLPRWRGAAPIQRAIEAGDAETGITLMHMDEGLDTGDMLVAEALAIGPEESAGQLHDRLAGLGARLLVDALPALERGELVRRPQPEAGVTYARKILKSESRIDWRRPARELADRIRAFDPFPGSVLELPGGMIVKVWHAQAVAGRPEAPPGTVLPPGPAALQVACGEGALNLTVLQKPGGKRVAAADFLRGQALAAGTVLALPPATDSA
jgi:methionyl-tRNA formyltransferase